eukprot:CAMPEP_0168339712 /NCGR_PEP_ID=MMETSP0213-20121227/13626_1 /TAXON_ID=151035 /ORGANISM="Euplotes harpa, Strain FSP1.4" /LENGTH=270 /DNA_ID=CAMNT_0008345799 /DNA_START=303 /DNA_END=1112 /DNA_ORIENTATION=-
MDLKWIIHNSIERVIKSLLKKLWKISEKGEKSKKAIFNSDLEKSTLQKLSSTLTTLISKHLMFLNPCPAPTASPHHTNLSSTLSHLLNTPLPPAYKILTRPFQYSLPSLRSPALIPYFHSFLMVEQRFFEDVLDEGMTERLKGCLYEGKEDGWIRIAGCRAILMLGIARLKKDLDRVELVPRGWQDRILEERFEEVHRESDEYNQLFMNENEPEKETEPKLEPKNELEKDSSLIESHYENYQDSDKTSSECNKPKIEENKREYTVLRINN